MKRISIYNRESNGTAEFQGKDEIALGQALNYAYSKALLSEKEYREAVACYSVSRNDAETVKLLRESIPQLFIKIRKTSAA